MVGVVWWDIRGILSVTGGRATNFESVHKHSCKTQRKQDQTEREDNTASDRYDKTVPGILSDFF